MRIGGQRRNMSVSREHITARTRQLNAIVDAIFEVFESVHEMLRDWKHEYHMLFIEQVTRLQKHDSCKQRRAAQAPPPPIRPTPAPTAILYTPPHPSRPTPYYGN